MSLILGLDLGKKIGIARGRLSVRMAFPYKTVYSFNDLVKEVNKMNPLYLVVGLPLLINGEEGLQCQRVKSMVGNLLHQTYKMDVFFEDERFSTQIVAHWSKDEDSASATYILQKYLNKIFIER